MSDQGLGVAVRVGTRVGVRVGRGIVEVGGMGVQVVGTLVGGVVGAGEVAVGSGGADVGGEMVEVGFAGEDEALVGDVVVTVGLTCVGVIVVRPRVGVGGKVGAIVGVTTKRVFVSIGPGVWDGISVGMAVAVSVAVGMDVTVTEGVPIGKGLETAGVIEGVGEIGLLRNTAKATSKQPTRASNTTPPTPNPVNMLTVE